MENVCLVLILQNFNFLPVLQLLTMKSQMALTKGVFVNIPTLTKVGPRRFLSYCITNNVLIFNQR